MRTMQAVQVAKAGGALELVERDVPAPPAGHVLIKVQACGICHSDSSPRTATGRASSIRACRATRLRA